MATSFNGPLKVYQRQNPTNDGSGNGLVATAGAVAANQYYTTTGAVTANTSNIARIPAGSWIDNVKVIFTNPGGTAYTAGTLNVVFLPDGGAASGTLGTITVPAVAAGTTQYATVTWLAAQPGALLSNTGTAAGYLQVTGESVPAGAQNLYQVTYVVRNSDGSITNTGANLSNN